MSRAAKYLGDARRSGHDDTGKLRFASAIVIALLIFLALFTAAMTVIFCLMGSVPDALIIAVFGVGAAEFVSVAAKRIFAGKTDNMTE